MKNLKKLSRENLKTVKGGVKQGCPGPGHPMYSPYASETDCQVATGKTCSYYEESYCFPAGWNADLL